MNFFTRLYCQVIFRKNPQNDRLTPYVYIANHEHLPNACIQISGMYGDNRITIDRTPKYDAKYDLRTDFSLIKKSKDATKNKLVRTLYENLFNRKNSYVEAQGASSLDRTHYQPYLEEMKERF